MIRCPKCNTYMNWYLKYDCAQPYDGYHCPSCGYDTQNFQCQTNNHVEPLTEYAKMLQDKVDKMLDYKINGKSVSKRQFEDYLDKIIKKN